MQYKFRSLGAEVNTLSKVHGNNKLVHASIAADKDLCKKKHAAITFYQIRKAIAAEIIFYALTDLEKIEMTISLRFLATRNITKLLIGFLSNLCLA